MMFKNSKAIGVSHKRLGCGKQPQEVQNTQGAGISNFPKPSASADFVSEVNKQLRNVHIIVLLLIVSYNNSLLFTNTKSDERFLPSRKHIRQTPCSKGLAVVGVDTTQEALLKYRQRSLVSWYLKLYFIPFYVQRKFPGSAVKNKLRHLPGPWAKIVFLFLFQ